MRFAARTAVTSIALLIGASAVTADRLAAQAPARATVRGVVIDSLRGARPIVGAVVQQLSSFRRTTTDSVGRFSLTLDASGTPTIAVTASRFDSLGIDYLVLPVTDAASELTFATPSPARYHTLRCGAPLMPGTGVIVGRARLPGGDAARGRAVWAGWNAISVRAGQAVSEAVATLDTADADGWFSLCGVPVGEPVVVRASGAGPTTGAVYLDIAERVERLDLVLGVPTDLVEIRGRVVRSDSGRATAVASAQVDVLDDARPAVATDDAGRFRLMVARRTATLTVRAIGFEPHRVVIPVGVVEDGEWEIAFPSAAVRLAATTVVADRASRDRAEFERRRRIGLGTFVTDEMLKNVPRVTPNVIFSMAPRTASRQTRQGPELMLRRGHGFCSPLFHVDGIKEGRLGPVDQGWLLDRAKRVEIYTANAAPAEFPDFEGCGVVIVWTR